MQRLDQRIVMAGIGFGCLLSLTAFALWNPLAYLPSLLAQTSPRFYVMANLGFSISYAMVALAYCIIPQRLPRILFACIVGFLVLGYLLSGYSLGGMFAFPEFLLNLSAICIGLGCGFGMVCWMIIFSSFGLKKACGTLIAGSIFAAIPTLSIYFIVRDNPSLFVTFVLVILLLSIVFLVLSIRDKTLFNVSPNQSKKDNTSKSWRKDIKNNALVFYRIMKGFGISIPCILAFALVQPLLDAIGLNNFMSTFSKTLTSQLGNVAGALAILLIWKLGNWETNVSKVFIWITPVFATTCLFFPFVSEQYWFIFAFLSMMLFALLSIAMMVSCLHHAQVHGYTIVVVYSFLACFLYIPSFIGGILGAAAAQAGISPRAALIAALLIFACISIVLAIQAWRRSLAPVADRTSISELASCPDRAPISGSTTAAHESTAAVHGSTTMTLESMDKAPLHGLYDQVTLACQEVARSYSLSKRESEVMSLMAQGRDVPFISEALNLSPHTVRGYIKGLYHAMNIHSKQELIDHIEYRAYRD